MKEEEALAGWKEYFLLKRFKKLSLQDWCSLPIPKLELKAYPSPPTDSKSDSQLPQSTDSSNNTYASTYSSGSSLLEENAAETSSQLGITGALSETEGLSQFEERQREEADVIGVQGLLGDAQKSNTIGTIAEVEEISDEAQNSNCTSEEVEEIPGTSKEVKEISGNTRNLHGTSRDVIKTSGDKGQKLNNNEKKENKTPCHRRLLSPSTKRTSRQKETEKSESESSWDESDTEESESEEDSGSEYEVELPNRKRKSDMKTPTGNTKKQQIESNVSSSESVDFGANSTRITTKASDSDSPRRQGQNAISSTNTKCRSAMEAMQIVNSATRDFSLKVS